LVNEGPAADNWVSAVSDDGMNVYAYNNSANDLYKSTDAGVTFTNLTVAGLPSNPGTTFTLDAIEIAPDGTLVAIVNITVTAGSDPAVGVYIYGSTNGGVNWSNISLPAGIGAVTTVDITNGPTIIVGTATGNIYIYKSTGSFGGGWQSMDPAGGTTFAGTYAILTMAFSPNYATDNMVYFVANDGTDTTVWSIYGPREPGADYGYFDSSLLVAPLATFVATGATIAFPADFNKDSNHTIIVGTNSASANNGVYKLTWTAQAGTAVVLPSRLSTEDVIDVAFAGPLASGTLFIAKVAGAVDYSTTVTAASPTWTASNATGVVQNLNASKSGDKVYALSQSAAGFNGSLSMTGSTSVNFKQLNLLQFNLGLGGTSLTLKAMDFMNDTGTMIAVFTDSVATSDTVFRKADAASPWVVIKTFAAETFNGIQATADNAVYVYQTGNNKIYKSIDGGLTFSAYLAMENIGAFEAVNATSYYYSNATTSLYKGSAFTPVTMGGNINSITYVDANTLYVGGTAGQVWKSTDGGTTFAAVGTVAPGTGAMVVLQAVDGTLYAADATAGAGVFKYNSTTSAWAAYNGAAPNVMTAGATIVALAEGPNGTLYAIDSAVANNATTLLKNTTGTDWQSIVSATNGWNAGVAITANGVKAFNNTVYAYSAAYAGSFGDIIIAAPVVSGPAADAVLDISGVNITWAAVNGATTYRVRVSTTEDMTTGVLTLSAPAGVTSLTNYKLAAADLVTGEIYYFTVQVTAPYLSKVSAPVKFMTKLSTAGTDISAASGLSPAGGTVVNATSPSFQWAAVASATGYEFVLASDANFTNVIESKTLTSTVYTTTQTLDPGVYYWQVRAVNASSSSDWAQGTFRVEEAATVAPTSQPTQPVTTIVTQPTYTLDGGNGSSGTPAWAWVVIAIGAVLVIAVIVLIVRTRRV
jgi:hypothetical protein